MVLRPRNVNRFVKFRLPRFFRPLRAKVAPTVSTVTPDVVDEDQPISMVNPYTKELRKCVLCKLNIEPDYKNVRLLSQFQSTYTGRIYGRHITGLCTAKQKKVEGEILKAQNAGMMGYYMKEPKWMKDPKLFDPDNPFKPHKY